MKIHTSTIDDLKEIFRLYGLATAYQKTIFPANTWPTFNQEMVVNEIQEQRQFKMTLKGQMVCIWAITFSDPQIWEGRDKDPAIYIHRIATNPEFRGRRSVDFIVAWARVYARSHQKKFIRMDTCGHNQKLINHYIERGFEFLGMVRLKNTDKLPSHYQDADVCLFEIQL